MRNHGGFTLIELMVVITILGIVASLATMSWSSVRKYRLVSATQQLSSDLQGLRQKAMIRRDSPNGRGFGIRFLSNRSYELFEFVDTSGSGHKEFQFDGADEEVGRIEKKLATGLTVTKKGADPAVAGDVFLYDQRGFLRDVNWGDPFGRTYILSGNGGGQARCVTLAQVRIREGVWNGTECVIR